jgi:hypothetical protein
MQTTNFKTTCALKYAIRESVTTGSESTPPAWRDKTCLQSSTCPNYMRCPYLSGRECRVLQRERFSSIPTGMTCVMARYNLIPYVQYFSKTKILQLLYFWKETVVNVHISLDIALLVRMWTDVSETRMSSIFGVESQLSKTLTRSKWPHKNWGNMVLRNASWHKDYTALYPRRYQYLYLPMWEPQFEQDSFGLSMSQCLFVGAVSLKK